MDLKTDYFERLVYSGVGGQRYTQDSPIMPDVWIRYGICRGERLPLLLTPNDEVTPGELAKGLRKAFEKHATVDGPPPPATAKSTDPGPQIAYNQTVVAADLLFHELIRIALPLSVWWKNYFVEGAGQKHARYFSRQDMRDQLEEQFGKALSRQGYAPLKPGEPTAHIVWLVRVIGTIGLLNRFPEIEVGENGLALTKKVEGLQAEDLEDSSRLDSLILDDAFAAFDGVILPRRKATPVLWSVNRNRNTVASLFDSGRAVKADAARRVFEVKGSGITWAVLDSGIDARHMAFRKRDDDGDKPLTPAFKPRRSRWINQTRVRETYDFVKIRELLSVDPATGRGLPDGVLHKVTGNQRADLLRILKNGRVIDWEVLRPWLQIPHEGDGRYQPPKHPHGTHVAGILGADWRPPYCKVDGDEDVVSPDHPVVGIAPEIELIDLRVIKDTGRTDEFSVMSGMQFIRHLNATHDLRQVHGANLSFSLRHDFTVFACGQTPVCQEAERLIGNGTVVVTAAGNEGMARFETPDANAAGGYRVESGYRSISITDPGNAEKVITVGSTHRRDPHTYGVSYFSSRGPTGDGRRKPDLVAPGEKITAPWPGNAVGEMDGTSQAAPHVSGAAALLMTRNPELIGQPEFIKRILCESATDLGREAYFQGAGMLDILRALQSI